MLNDESLLNNTSLFSPNKYKNKVILNFLQQLEIKNFMNNFLKD